ncbi:TylF/MycF/NovP-related O-methyltransferase [Urbifossiella limnaea]|uniref:Macrocin O-methyltransferase n=1 Tax=Urbifossiella limnaea TaxID=2528023 RepID=A0A517Y0Y9_9BACT|nr:TylF/MycF/NovP-related O-methyltransferase [Urbifossiella limnaea]QDU23429.1 Macrocin O-methyltransferase [Urbifossiella limnaea]
MPVVTSLKAMTRPWRARLARLLYAGDDGAARAATAVADRRAADLAAAHDQLARSEDARAAAESARAAAEREAAELRQMTWEKAVALMTAGRNEKDWEAAARLVNRAVDELVRPWHKSVTWGDRLLTLDKSASVIREPVFQEALNTFRGLHPYDQYDGPDTIAWRLNTLVWAARRAVGLDGDFVECGVFKGDMAYTVARCVSFEKLPKTFHLYDSFEGYSPKYTSADDFRFNPNFLDMANAAYRIPRLYETVRDRFAGYPNVTVVRGFVPDALDMTAHQKIAFLHIDLNSPRAEVACLETLFDRVVPGGVVLLDDYGWIDFVAQKEAEDEFFGRRGYQVLELPTGQGMVVKR